MLSSALHPTDPAASFNREDGSGNYLEISGIFFIKKCRSCEFNDLRVLENVKVPLKCENFISEIKQHDDRIINSNQIFCGDDVPVTPGVEHLTN